MHVLLLWWEVYAGLGMQMFKSDGKHEYGAETQ